MTNPKLSVIVCTYDPREDIFRRAVASVAKAIASDPSLADGAVEWVIVDNNSPRPVADLPYVRDAGARVVVERQQGLVHARLRGLAETTAPVVIFFDDDNECEPAYLGETVALFQEYPSVGIFGPGHVTVDFVDGAPAWVDRGARHWFQERHTSRDQWGIADVWADFYPPGTGVTCRRAAIATYAARASSGELTVKGRTGKKLTSGEDGQMLWTAMREQWAVGVSPRLRVNHLIPGSRCTWRYLYRLSLGLAECVLTGYVEVFPEDREARLARAPTFRRFLIDGFKAALLRAPALRWRDWTFDVARNLGIAASYYLAARKPIPRWLTLSAKVMRLEL